MRQSKNLKPEFGIRHRISASSLKAWELTA
jgi:hypothetical protein